MKSRNDQPWIPLWVDKWLFGSTRYELTNSDRAIWVDFLALAAKDNGHIRANKGFPYPLQALAGILNIEPDILSKTIETFEKHGKIIVEENGVIQIKQWDNYQLSERHKRRLGEEEKEIVWDDSKKSTCQINSEISGSMYYSIKKKTDGGLWEKLLGYTRKDLFIHLEKMFVENMGWGNYGEWHIDHKKPLTYAKYTSFTQIDEIREFWELGNLRPLWAQDNLKRPRKGHDVKINGHTPNKSGHIVYTNKKTNKKSITTTLPEKYLSDWNKKMPFKVKALSDRRKKHLQARLEEKDFVDNFNLLMEKILASPFLLGKRGNERHPNFKADFDWLIGNNTNYLKILEGKYNDRKSDAPY